MPHCKKQMISFFLTTKCNLRCIYCYNSQEREVCNQQSLSLDIAKSGIDEFFSNNDSRHIRFYGPGEPTLELKLMADITEYAKKVGGDEVTVELQTNGTFGAKARKWVLNNVNVLWVSFDGTPDIQNYQRPFPTGKPSSSSIEKNVKWLLLNKNQRDLMVGARVTITENNVRRQIETIDYLKSLGIKYIWNDPEFQSVENFPVVEDCDRHDMELVDMDMYVQYFLEAYKYAKSIDCFYGSILTCNFDGRSNMNCRACTSSPHLTPDGYVSVCDMIAFGKDARHMDCFIIGKYCSEKNSFEYDKEKMKSLKNRTSDNLPHCKDCEAKYHCAGYCLGEVVNITGKLDGQIPSICKSIRKLFMEIGETEEFDYFHS